VHAAGQPAWQGKGREFKNMHSHEKLSFEAVTDYTMMPKLVCNRVECPQCHYIHAVPLEFVDWHEVAETYQRAHEKMCDSFFALLKEAGEQFDVPLVEYFWANNETFIAELRQLIEHYEAQRTPPAQKGGAS
jgi:hypothetical protein